MIPADDMKESVVELFCKLGGMLVGGGGIIAVIQISEVKDWVSIVLGCVTGFCLLTTTFHSLFWKNRKRKRKE